ncbi:unnamed protein product [Ceutorhynchus assimilis]|uniref:EGF-like domain-containing protein n=1 Tax=Ceutorhynchus assimilis TaxID=467358 RepID=A0A9N9QIQ3_9CUCU|nr:unnamed protein product [Ceutorhynchus assimilis]
MNKCLVSIYISLLLVFNHTFAFNETCTEDTNCSAEEVCEDQVCKCAKLYTYSEEQNKCVKYATEYGSICYMDSQCTPFLGANSACINNICVCNAGNFRWYQGKCQQYASKNDSCTSDSLCMDLKNPLALKCGTGNTCECSDGYYDRGADCRLKSEKDAECAITMDCFPTMNQYLHCELGKCVENVKSESWTTDNFTNNYSIGKAFTSNAMVNNDASCPNGVASSMTKDECSQCSNAFFFQDSICICKQGFFLNDGKCIAELGMKSDEIVHYTNDSDCPIKPGKLVDGACYCRDYWFQHSTNRECKKTTLEYTHNCMDNDWCKAMGDYAYCNAETGKCQCSSQAELNETSFYCDKKKDADFTGLCLSDSECPLYESCIDERCQCDDGFYRLDQSDNCLPKIGSSCEVRTCNHIADAKCSNNTCECNSGYVTNGLLCLKPAAALNEECQIEQQCQNIKNSACLQDSTLSGKSTSRCLCIEEFRDVNGTCYALKTPGSLCSTKFDCTVILGDTFLCRNMLCQCDISQSLNQDNICVTNSSEKSYLSIKVIFLILLFKYLLS